MWFSHSKSGIKTHNRFGEKTKEVKNSSLFDFLCQKKIATKGKANFFIRTKRIKLELLRYRFETDNVSFNAEMEFLWLIDLKWFRLFCEETIA